MDRTPSRLDVIRDTIAHPGMWVGNLIQKLSEPVISEAEILAEPKEAV